MAKSHYSDRRIAQELTRQKAREVKILDGVPERHELWTCHPAGRAKRSLIQTHASGEENRIWVAPFTTNGTFMRARKISATIGTPKCRTTPTEDGWALWLYRYTIAPKGIKKDSPLSLPQGELASMLDVTDIDKRLYYPLTLDNLQEQKMFRLDLILRRDILLKPSEFYAIGFQSRTADSYWYCPVDSGTHYGAVPQGARRTYPVSGGHTFGTFPDKLKMQMDGPYDEIFVDMPAICIRSAAGVHALEPPVSVNESLAPEEDDDVPAAKAMMGGQNEYANSLTASTPAKDGVTTVLFGAKQFDDAGGTSNRVRYIGGVTREFEVTVSWTLSPASTDDLTVMLYINGLLLRPDRAFSGASEISPPASGRNQDVQAGKRITISFEYHLEMSNGDYLEVWLESGTTQTVTTKSASGVNLTIKSTT